MLPAAPLYAEMLDAVKNGREEIVLTRAGRDPAAIVSPEDYEPLKETAYPLRNPVNARRLLASIDRLASGDGTVREALAEACRGRVRLE
ncbi:type II toxin-antitoxin system prevent-host-death family antitoxin [Streptomyces sp. NPDC008121]|uniref:type II toxin-antitoxin system Phd/YefM family antitoxin n=1 Tax=Streptomyces sp. NPDC008121 TaxID=3364809 RepID=UPI0036EB54E9